MVRVVGLEPTLLSEPDFEQAEIVYEPLRDRRRFYAK